MSHQVAAGVILGCASAAAANAGVVVEKLAMRRMPAFDVRKTNQMIRRLVRSPIWVVGFSMIALGLAMQVQALSLASISVVQAVAPTGTVLLLVLSHIFLRDRLRRAEYFGIAALVLALALLVLSLDSHTDRAAGSTNLLSLLVVTIPTMCASIGVFLFASRLRGSAETQRKVRAPVYGFATGLLYGCAALDMKSIATLMQRWGVGPALPRIIGSPAFYLFIVTTVLAFLMFQMALQRSITSVLVPVSSVLSTAYFIIVGDALFHEQLPRAPLTLSLRLAAFAMLGVGLLALTIVNEAQDPEVHPAEEHGAAPLPVGAGAPAPSHAGPGLRNASERRHPQPTGATLPVGLSWPRRVRLAVFAFAGVATLLVGILPFPEGAPGEVAVACVLLLGLVGIAVLMPWSSLPGWVWLVLSIGYMAVIAIVRDAQGGALSGLGLLFVLPILWLALSGRRLYVLLGLFCMSLALLVPLLTVGPPKYPTLEWRQVAVLIAVTTLVVSTAAAIFSRRRAILDDLARPSDIARLNASEALQSQGGFEALLRAAIGTAIIGVDQSGTVTFFSAGAEEMLGYAEAEVVGSRSITEIMDPTPLDQIRHTSEAMRTVSAIPDEQAAAEVPWTAFRKDGQRLRCVVRVRAVPVVTSVAVAGHRPGNASIRPEARTSCSDLDVDADRACGRRVRHRGP